MSQTSQIRRRTTKLRLDDAPTINPEDVEQAIKRAQPSKAAGRHEINSLHLKKLGSLAVSYLCNTFQLSLNTGIIPTIWRKSNVIPLPKTGKDHSVGKNWRPIILLSATAKIMERILLPHVETDSVLQPTQHSFRKHHSTNTALHHIVADITRGFNHKKPADTTILVALDLIAAFDTVDHSYLAERILLNRAPDSVKRWMTNFLLDRQAKVNFRGKCSKPRNIHAGIVQGGVLSPTLFNLYMADSPVPPEDIRVIIYADDGTLYTSGPDTEDLVDRLNR